MPRTPVDPEALMREALAEGRKGLGLTAPNPAVGAVVARKGTILGRGYHPRAGSPHAEPRALRDAGDAARGADLFVTLEPCCTHGRTPPCTEAILAAGIRRVFIGCTDPFAAHAGRGLDLLRAGGVEVISGILEAECRHLIRGFARVQETGLPYVTLKLGCTLDGRIAEANGRSQWITGPASRERVQVLRREVDAVLVGTETLRLDDPTLMPRPRLGHRPWRIVSDRRGRLPLSLKVFSDADASRTICLLGPDASALRAKRLRDRGVTVLPSAQSAQGFAWKPIFRDLAARGIHHILCEGGGKLAASLLGKDLLQEIFWIQAPRVLGRHGRPAVDGVWSLGKAPPLVLDTVERVGDDVWFRLLPQGKD